jgi:transcriptional regulator with XRE-family HTH domain
MANVMFDTSSATAAAEATVQRFARNLRHRRRAISRTQQQAASLAGVAGSSWSKVEHGAHAPSIRTAARMAAGVDATLSDLLADQKPDQDGS